MRKRPAQELIEKHIPFEFLVGLVREADAARREARALLVAFPETEAHDARPAVLRACFEVRFRALGKKFGAEFAVKANKAGNSFHTEVRFGPIVLTQAVTSSAGEAPRHTEYRANIALSPELQTSLFPYFGEVGQQLELRDGDRVSMVVAHGPGTGGALASYILIGVPSPEMDRWLDRYLLTDLRDFEELAPAAEESVAAELHLSLKSGTKKESGEGA